MGDERELKHKLLWGKKMKMYQKSLLLLMGVGSFLMGCDDTGIETGVIIKKENGIFYMDIDGDSLVDRSIYFSTSKSNEYATLWYNFAIQGDTVQFYNPGHKPELIEPTDLYSTDCVRGINGLSFKQIKKHDDILRMRQKIGQPYTR